MRHPTWGQIYVTGEEARYMNGRKRGTTTTRCEVSADINGCPQALTQTSREIRRETLSLLLDSTSLLCISVRAAVGVKMLPERIRHPLKRLTIVESRTAELAEECSIQALVRKGHTYMHQKSPGSNTLGLSTNDAIQLRYLQHHNVNQEYKRSI